MYPIGTAECAERLNPPPTVGGAGRVELELQVLAKPPLFFSPPQAAHSARPAQDGYRL